MIFVIFVMKKMLTASSSWCASLDPKRFGDVSTAGSLRIRVTLFAAQACGLERLLLRSDLVALSIDVNCLNRWLNYSVTFSNHFQLFRFTILNCFHSSFFPLSVALYCTDTI